MPIDNRKDVLLLLLHAPGPNGEKAEPITGRTRLQKLLFLLGEEHKLDRLVQNYYRYRAYKFGPFSRDLVEDLEFLENLGFLSEEATGGSSLAEDEELEQSYDFLTPEDASELPWASSVPRFELTEKGREFVEKQLLPHLSQTDAAALETVKVKLGSIPLTNLLRYVYKRHPEAASETKLTHLK